MRSKAYHSFMQRIHYFDDDIELIDVLRESVLGGDLTGAESKYVLRRVDPVRHKHLARRNNANGSRYNAINHLRSSIYSSYVKDAYEEVTDYLKAVLRCASRQGFNTGRLIGEHSFKMDATTVLSLGDWDAVCRTITDSVFQTLEAERSTLNLLKKTATKLALNVDQTLIEATLPYLETRHFLVHSDGLLSAEFLHKYPQIRHQDNYVTLDYAFITEFRDNIVRMIENFDAEIIGANFLHFTDIHGQ